MQLAHATAEQLLVRAPQCARRLARRLFRIFTRRVLRISATSRRGAAAYGDDNTFLFRPKSPERALLRVSQLVARSFLHNILRTSRWCICIDVYRFVIALIAYPPFRSCLARTYCRLQDIVATPGVHTRSSERRVERVMFSGILIIN